MDEKFFALSEALTELNDLQALENLRSIKEHVDAGTFFVAFIGQYSAGKSSLINNLLDRQILPGGRVETTPILTYILYGSEEGGRLFYFDGSTEDIDLDAVMEITQSNNSTLNLEELEHLEIFLNEKLLADGMILLDTPGINTVIERHEHLLANSLSLASAIIYVAGGAPSRIDIEKLQDFVAQGFSVSFVRTHCDEIKDWEESYRQVVSADEDVLNNCGLLNSLEHRFFISNIPESQYFVETKKIRDLLFAKGTSAQIEIERMATLRLKVIAERVIRDLKDLQSTLRQKKHERDEIFDKRCENIDAEINRLRNVLQERRCRLDKEVKTCLAALKRDMERYAQTSGDKVAKIIKSAGDDVKTNADMEEYIRQRVRPILNNAFNIINLQVSPILKDINGELRGEDFNGIGTDAFIEDLPDLENYSEVMDYQNSELEELRRNIVVLQKNREDLQVQLSTSNSNELENDLLQLESELETLKREHGDMGTFTPKMVQVDPGDSSAAQMGKRLGNILDWAMLLLPQGMIVNAATKAGLLSKIATAPTKISKAVKGLLFGKEVTKTYVTANRLAKAKNFMLSTVQTVNKAKENAPTSLLDYLTLENWGEKLGQQFDDPPRYEEDLSYRRDYFERKRQIEDGIRQKQRDIYRRKEELGAFKNEQERRAARLASLDIDERELNRRLKVQEEKLQREATKKARQNWKEQWAEHYREILPKFLIAQTEQYLVDLPERLKEYQARRFASLEEKLAKKKAEYDSLVNMCEDDVAKKLQRTEKLLQFLESTECR